MTYFTLWFSFYQTLWLSSHVNLNRLQLSLYILCPLVRQPVRIMFALGVVAEWSKVLSAVPWLFMVWSTLALGTYHLRFVSWVFHIIFSFVHFISLYTLGDLCAFRKPLPCNMYLFNLRIANHVLIKIFKNKCLGYVASVMFLFSQA